MIGLPNPARPMSPERSRALDAGGPLVHRAIGLRKEHGGDACATRRSSAAGTDVEYLDGDALRAVFPTTGFTREERNEHIRRTGFLASRLEAHGVTVVASFVSPYRESREFVRGLCRNFHRGLRGDAARGVRAARRERSLRSRAPGRNFQLHGHQRPVRAPGASGDQLRYPDCERRGGGCADPRAIGRSP